MVNNISNAHQQVVCSLVRSENVVKNKFNCSLRKFVRKLNKHMSFSIHKYKKKIRFESAVRAMDAFECFTQLPTVAKQWSLDIRQKLIHSTLNNTKNKATSIPELQWLAENIKKFCLQTRSYKTRKIRFAKSSCSQQMEISVLSKQNVPEIPFTFQPHQVSEVINQGQQQQFQDDKVKKFLENDGFLDSNAFKCQINKLNTFQSILQDYNLRERQQMELVKFLQKEMQNLQNSQSMIDLLFNELPRSEQIDFWM